MMMGTIQVLRSLLFLLPLFLIFQDVALFPIKAEDEDSLTMLGVERRSKREIESPALPALNRKKRDSLLGLGLLDTKTKDSIKDQDTGLLGLELLDVVKHQKQTKTKDSTKDQDSNLLGLDVLKVVNQKTQTNKGVLKDKVVNLDDASLKESLIKKNILKELQKKQQSNEALKVDIVEVNEDDSQIRNEEILKQLAKELAAKKEQEVKEKETKADVAGSILHKLKLR